MKSIQNEVGFLPIIKAVLAHCDFAMQVQLTKYLLSLQPKNDSNDPSQDYLELRS